MNFDKTDLKENVLIITNEDGSITCIPQEGAIQSEQALFNEFRDKFPLGKENYKLVDGEAIELTVEEKAALHPVITIEPSQEDYLLDLDYRLSLIELGV